MIWDCCRIPQRSMILLDCWLKQGIMNESSSLKSLDANLQKDCWRSFLALKVSYFILAFSDVFFALLRNLKSWWNFTESSWAASLLPVWCLWNFTESSWAASSLPVWCLWNFTESSWAASSLPVWCLWNFTESSWAASSSPGWCFACLRYFLVIFLFSLRSFKYLSWVLFLFFWILATLFIPNLVILIL